jgi:hypothetical protein
VKTDIQPGEGQAEVNTEQDQLDAAQVWVCGEGLEFRVTYYIYV